MSISYRSVSLIFLILMLGTRRFTAWVMTKTRTVPQKWSLPRTRQLCATTATTTNDELAQLSAQIDHHNYLYYVTSNPILSDEEYDALIQRELYLKAQQLQDRPVGAPVDNHQNTRQHTIPMLSLDNAFSNEQVQEWLDKIQKINDITTTTTTILSEPKLDGVSLHLHYTKTPLTQQYQFTWACTRGDGKQGTDVTAAVLEMNIPTTVPACPQWSDVDSFDVRGELILPKHNNNNNKNARNAASGLLLRKESHIDLRQELKFYAYDLLGVNNITTGVAMRDLLVSMGFAVPLPIAITTLTNNNTTSESLNSLATFHSSLIQQRDILSHEIDGAVHKVNDMTLRTLLGATSRAPRWALAHKFPALVVMTPLCNMIVQVGRTGALTPVAVFEPVDINGVSVQRATLHTFGFVQTIFEGRTEVPVGTLIMLRRAGDVIPQVIRTMPSLTNNTDMISLQAPTHCPACHSPVVVATEDDAVLRCGGPPLQCPPRAIAALGHAFSRDALDVKGLSEKKIEQLRNESILKRPSDLFQWNDTHTVASLPGWGPKSANVLYEAAQQVVRNGVSLGRFIYSLGIRFAGQQSSDLIAAQYGTVEAFLNDKDFACLETVKGIGPVLLSSLRAFAQDEDMVQAARALADAIRVKPVEMVARPAVGDLPWSGWTVVFTGSVPGMSRSEAQTLAKELLGATSTPSTVSKSSTLVVAGEKGGKKLQQALDLGINVMNGEDFVELISKYR